MIIIWGLNEEDLNKKILIFCKSVKFSWDDCMVKDKGAIFYSWFRCAESGCNLLVFIGTAMFMWGLQDVFG